MRRSLRPSMLLAILVALPASSLAQPQNQSSDARRVFVDSLIISGTQTIDSAELAEITGALAGSEFDDAPEELQERVRDQFQNHGYFQVEVQKFEIKVIDPLASPKPIRIGAQLSEGPLCRLSTIEFTGNHLMSSEELRAMFPLKTGDVFKKPAVVAGLKAMGKDLGKLGMLESVAIPITNFDSSLMSLKIELEEGSQFHMGKLEVIGPAEVAGKLQARWQLDPGAVFDDGYVSKFLEENSSLLPSDFTQSNGVKLLKDCNSSTVSVHIHLTADALHEAQDAAKEQSDCRELSKKQAESKQ